jgi:hypothetical protein
MGADIARPTEAVRLIDGGTEGQRRQRTNARDRHQASACRLVANLIHHLLGELFGLARHRGDDR